MIIIIIVQTLGAYKLKTKSKSRKCVSMYKYNIIEEMQITENAYTKYSVHVYIL